MQTVYDWVTVAVFAMLVVLLLQRSVGPEEHEDKLYHYLIPASGCALANYLGNNGNGVGAFAVLGVAIAYAVYFLKPFPLR